MKKHRILLADDHKIVLEGLRSLLEPEFELVGMAEDGRTLLRMAENLEPDVVVADISMPRLNGIEAARQIKKLKPETKIVFLTMHPDVNYAARAFEVGASGYVLKHSAPSELVMAIHSVLKGRPYLSPGISEKVIEGYLDGRKTLKSRSSWETITHRERQILKLIGEGYKNKEIADYLRISVKTVEKHRANIMQKLDLHSSSALTAFAIEKGLIEKNPSI